MELSYEFIEGDTRIYRGEIVLRIRATRDIPAHGIKAGDYGGYIGKFVRLEGDAWVDHDAVAFGHAIIRDRARVRHGARVGESAMVSGQAQVHDWARVYGSAHVGGEAVIAGWASVGGYTKIWGTARVDGGAWVEDSVSIGEGARVSGPLDVLTGRIAATDTLACTLYRSTAGWRVRVGCWHGTVEGLREMAESNEWVESSRDKIEEARPELLAFVALCEARIKRVEGLDAQ